MHWKMIYLWWVPTTEGGGAENGLELQETLKCMKAIHIL